MDFFDLLSDFKQWWLSEGHSKNSAASYVAYIRKAVTVFSNYTYVKNNNLDSFLSNQQLVTRTTKDENKITRDIKILFTISLKESGNAFGAKKTYKNALSGLITFFNYMYLNNYQFKHSASEAKRIKKALVDSNSNNIVFKYSTKEIFKNFNGRINTQDRVYEKIVLNFCTINTVLNLDKNIYKEYSKLKKDKIYSTKFIVDVDHNANTKSIIPLSFVNQLIIKPSSECSIIDGNGIKHTVFTECDPFNGTIYEKLMPIDINQLSIDHDKTLNDLIGQNYQAYPSIIKLTEKIAKYFDYTGNDYKRIKSQIDNMKKSDAIKIINKEQLNVAFATSLLQDLKNLYNSMGYSIMYGPYNSKKSG